MNAIMYALQVLEALPGLIAAGQSVVALVQNTSEALKRMQAESRDPTDQEWVTLNIQIEQLRNKLHE